MSQERVGWDESTLPCTSEDGVTSSVWLHAQLQKDIQHCPLGPTVLMVPAMGVQARYYQRLAHHFAALGVDFAAMELRGHGSSSIRPSRSQDFGYRHIVEYDIPAAISVIRQHAPTQSVYLMGHSLGGQMSALFAAANRHVVEGYIGVACATVYWRNYGSGSIPLLLGTQTAGLVARSLGYFPGKRLGFAGLESRGVITDWARQSRTGDYQPSGSSLDYEKLLAQYQGRALVISIGSDSYAPRSAVDHLAEKTPGATVTRIHLPRGDFKNLKRVHFDWVKQPEPIMAHIETWLGSTV